MDTVNVSEARRNLAALLKRVAVEGERVIIQRDGEPVAALIGMGDLQRLEDAERQANAKRERGLAALESARRLREAILAERGGKYLPDSAELIREMREERMDGMAG
jgi:prevent-host-death family protein